MKMLLSPPVAQYVISVLLLVTVTWGFEVKFQARYYTDATLVCDASVFEQTITPFLIYWVLPDRMTVIQPAFVSDDKYISGKPWIDLNIHNLTVRRVDDDDFGWYQCVILWGNYQYLVSTMKIGLNVDGPSVASFMFKYRYPAICIGIVIAIFIAIAIAVCATHRRRKKKLNVSKERAVVSDLDKAIEGYDNVAADNNDTARRERSESCRELRRTSDIRRVEDNDHRPRSVATLRETDINYAEVVKDNNHRMVAYSGTRVPDGYYEEKL